MYETHFRKTAKTLRKDNQIQEYHINKKIKKDQMSSCYQSMVAIEPNHHTPHPPKEKVGFLRNALPKKKRKTQFHT
jgi:hypothetical protein